MGGDAQTRARKRQTGSDQRKRSGMRSPGCRVEEFHLLRLHQRPEFGREPLDERRVGEQACPERPAIRIVVELPHVNKLIDRARVRLEVTHQFLVETAFTQSRVTKLRVQLDRLAILPTCKV